MTSLILHVIIDDMKTLTVADFKTHFSQVVGKLKQGESFAISYGRNKNKVGIIMPYQQYVQQRQHRLGILKQTASYRMTDQFKITDEELLAA